MPVATTQTVFIGCGRNRATLEKNHEIFGAEMWPMAITISGSAASNHLLNGATQRNWGIAISSSTATPPGIISARRRCWLAATISRFYEAPGGPPGSPLEWITGAPALCTPTAALGRRNIVMRLEGQALPKAVAGKADQNKPADDHQTLQHRYWTSRAAVRFKSSRRTAARGPCSQKPPPRMA